MCSWSCTTRSTLVKSREEARLVFDHAAAQAHVGASIFWLRQPAALPNEEEAILSWQLKRDGTRRGIVEVTEA